MKNLHRPVMVTEVIENLITDVGGIYIDATFGRGGHATEILKKLNAQGKLFAIDRDTEAVEYAKKQIGDHRFHVQQGSFEMLGNFATRENIFGKVTGILFDLGVSSPQLDNAARGFSFQKEGPLDMRMDTTQKLTAEEWLNSAPENEIIIVLKEYGEERFAKRIASAIVRERKATLIHSTTQLAQIVAKANPRWEHRKHPATRTFQAIRIFINQELQQLKDGLEQALKILDNHGRLVVLSFHSLEDRIVKHFIQQEINSKNLLKIAKIKPSREEVQNNPRSRSALLRVAEKQQFR